MARGRRKKPAVKNAGVKAPPSQQQQQQPSDGYSLRTRRSSMRVNLSFVSTFSDSGQNSLLKRASNQVGCYPEQSFAERPPPRAAKKRKTRKPSTTEEEDTTVTLVTDVTVIEAAVAERIDPDIEAEVDEVQRQSSSLAEKEQQLSKSCMQLKDAIMSKTLAFFDRENELAIKTSEILTGHSSSFDRDVELDEANDKRTPSIKVDIGKNEQIIMSGDGRKKNPVEVNSMLKKNVPEKETTSSQTDDEDYMECNQSIVSTPKKTRIDRSVNKGKSSEKTVETTLSIPVARLFVEDIDPNNSMSEFNTVTDRNSEKRTDTSNVEVNKSDDGNINNTSSRTNELNYTSSPILSQGIRRSRLSRLSLKKNLGKSLTKITTEESFVNNVPVTCSSFIEKENDKNIQKDIDKNSNTINLDDSKNNKTIDIGDSTNKSSSMEITTVSSKMPIIHRPFQTAIRKSLRLDNLIVGHDNDENFKMPTQIQKDKTSKNLSKENNGQSMEKAQSSNDCQESSSFVSMRTSLAVNTSLDQIDSADSIAQKENKEPNNSNEIATLINKNQVDEDETTILQRQSTSAISADNVKKSFPNTSRQTRKRSSKISEQQISDNNKDKESNDKAVTRQSSMDSNQEKENSDKITLRQPSTSTVRSSMQVNTSLDSVRKSPVKNVLDFNKILSMVEETTANEHQSKASIYSSNNQTSDSDDELENVSLMERLRNISAERKNKEFKKPNISKKSTNINNISLRKRKKSIENESINIGKKKKSVTVENTTLNVTKNSSEAGTINSNMTKKSSDSENTSLNLRKSSGPENIDSNTKKSCSTENTFPNVNKSCNVENTNCNTRKSYGPKNTSLNVRKSCGSGYNSTGTNESGIVETTPYPTSRSVLLKTFIKNSIAMNTIDTRKFVDFSDNEDSSDELQTIIKENTKSSPKKCKSVYSRKETLTPNSEDTIILNSSDESSSESDKERKPVIIEESINVSKVLDKSHNKKSIDKPTSDKVIVKRKLYPLRENSQISLSPSESQEPEKVEIRPKLIKKKKRRNATQTKKPNNKPPLLSPELGNETEPEENEILPIEIEKKKKKPRKILRKKIKVKKVTNLTILDNMMQNNEEHTQRLSQRNSLREFDLRRMQSRHKERTRKNHRIVIVVTGLPKGDKDLVKSVIKALGSAVLEVNVTPRTTHVISSGVRTINLLKGILRGCWLLSLEWALKSLEAGKWLDPSPYEMTHFAKAVQENRRDRQLFGKAYIPELFVTSGLIYIENGTSPPAPVLKELVKIAGGRITEDPNQADIEIGSEGLKEIWILDSITTGEVQSPELYKRN